MQSDRRNETILSAIGIAEKLVSGSLIGRAEKKHHGRIIGDQWVRR